MRRSIRFGRCREWMTGSGEDPPGNNPAGAS